LAWFSVLAIFAGGCLVAGSFYLAYRGALNGSLSGTRAGILVGAGVGLGAGLLVYFGFSQGDLPTSLAAVVTAGVLFGLYGAYTFRKT
jgi:hypothetical protein